MNTNKIVVLEKVEFPNMEVAKPVELSNETIKEREKKIQQLMKQYNYDCIVIYADVEHGANFEYLTGFIPRFEEALLVYHANKDSYLLLGNEVLSLGKYSRIDAECLHISYFSLPDQPLTNQDLRSTFEKAKIKDGMCVGVVGWKGFYNLQKQYFDIPYYMVEALQSFEIQLKNATDLFISPAYGARTTNNANEIAHYEYGQILASNGIKKALQTMHEGKSELDIASDLESHGQVHSVVTICSSGERFKHANIYPLDKAIHKGERISLTVGYKGGLASRAAFVASCREDLPEQVKDYEEAVAKPYFLAISEWLQHIHIGMKGDELYQLTDTVLPRKHYHWSLNPGHLCADEEWLSSPVYENSTISLKSGMLFQIDIIPRVEGYPGCCCENGIILADAKLKESLILEYPEMYNRMMERRAYIIDVLGVELHEDVLPLSNMVAYYSPYVLDQERAYTMKS